MTRPIIGTLAPDKKKGTVFSPGRVSGVLGGAREPSSRLSLSSQVELPFSNRKC